MDETWLPVPDYEGYYEISSEGNVRSLRVGVGKNIKPGIMMLNPGTAPNGYKVLRLSVNYVQQTVYVHDLVLLAFVGPKPKGLRVRHLNDIKSDCSLTNLIYGTHRENMQDMLRNGNNYFKNKTHCPHGHEYTPENTYLNKGRRFCRACDRARRKLRL